MPAPIPAQQRTTDLDLRPPLTPRRNRLIPWWCYFLLSLIWSSTAACAKPQDPDAAANQGAGPAAAQRDEPYKHDGVVEATAESAAPVSRARQLIQMAELHLELPAYEPAKQAVDRLLADNRGYLQSARLEHRDGRVSQAELVLRLPADCFQSTIDELSQLGTVLHQQLDTRDVTEQYADLRVRRHNAQQLEQRLLQLLAQPSKVEQLLKVEQEIARVREKIDQLTGRIKAIDRQVAYSTLTLRLTTRLSFAAGPPRPVGEQLSTTLGKSWRAFRAFGRALLVAAVAMAPWLPLIGLLVWLSRLTYRWARRRLTPVHTAPPAAPRS